MSNTTGWARQRVVAGRDAAIIALARCTGASLSELYRMVKSYRFIAMISLCGKALMRPK
jgi:hypothetical protein